MTSIISLFLLGSIAHAEEPASDSSESSESSEEEAESAESAGESKEDGEVPSEGAEAPAPAEGEAAPEVPAEAPKAAGAKLEVSVAIDVGSKDDSTDEAADSESGARHGVSLGLGALGASVSYIYAANMDCSLSVQGHFFESQSVKKINGTSYDDTTNFQALSVLVHYHPIKGMLNPLRLTAGLTTSLSTVELEASGTEYQIGDTVYDFNRSVFGDVAFNALQPYLAIGSGINSRKGLGFYSDLGMIYQGNPSASLEAPEAEIDGLKEDIATELAFIEEAYAPFAIYPLLQLGATYMF
jgi:hypothetical protein